MPPIQPNFLDHPCVRFPLRRRRISSATAFPKLSLVIFLTAENADGMLIE
jgi:hypothetical protein